AAALAASEYLASVHGRLAGVPALDLDLERRVQALVLDAHERQLLTAAHDCSDGGLAVTLAESCLAGDVGFEATDLDLGARLDGALFGETQSRLIVTVGSAADAEALLALAADVDVPATVIGTASGDRLRLGPVDVTLDAARDAYDGALERALAG
ncbi:MAG: AIR synthase-related protein, partial [Vicinamibacterales bacterium]|nr:AIR synthase-related protein [Vicinamibacterales bacterium]